MRNGSGNPEACMEPCLYEVRPIPCAADIDYVSLADVHAYAGQKLEVKNIRIGALLVNLYTSDSCTIDQRVGCCEPCLLNVDLQLKTRDHCLDAFISPATDRALLKRLFTASGSGDCCRMPQFELPVVVQGDLSISDIREHRPVLLAYDICVLDEALTTP